jgi:CubicO group peptidase (beta-lactamase class C family)
MGDLLDSRAWRSLILLLATGCATTGPGSSDRVISSSSVRWNGRELVPPRWIKEMLTPTSGGAEADEYVKGMSYGKLWWIFDDSKSRPGGPLQGAYTAIGAYGQYITVIPKLGMVVAHKVVHQAKEKVDVPVYRVLIDLRVACRISRG